MDARGGEQGEGERRHRRQPAGGSHTVPAGRIVIEQAVAEASVRQAEPEREHRGDESPCGQPEPQAPGERRGEQAGDRQGERDRAREKRAFVLRAHRVPDGGGRSAPDAALDGRGEERLG